jgi:hypothetical protein
MTTHLRSWIAAMIATALCAASPAGAQGESDVSGAVIDGRTGEPVAAATITAGRRETTTDARGGFRLCRVTDPTPLTVTAPGYHGDTARVALVPGGTAEVRVRLQADTTDAISIQLDRPRRVSPDTPLPVYVVDGERVFLVWSGCETPPPGIRTMDVPAPDEIEAVYILHPRTAARQFGPDGEHGAVYVTLRRERAP